MSLGAPTARMATGRDARPRTRPSINAAACGGRDGGTFGLAVGWLNWGFYDQPEASDCSQLTGLLTADGKPKAWGREFQKLADTLKSQRLAPAKLTPRPTLDWERCVTSSQAGNQFRQEYYQAFKTEPQR